MRPGPKRKITWMKNERTSRLIIMVSIGSKIRNVLPCESFLHNSRNILPCESRFTPLRLRLEKSCILYSARKFNTLREMIIILCKLRLQSRRIQWLWPMLKHCVGLTGDRYSLQKFFQNSFKNSFRNYFKTLPNS